MGVLEAIPRLALVAPFVVKHPDAISEVSAQKSADVSPKLLRESINDVDRIANKFTGYTSILNEQGDASRMRSSQVS